MGAADVAIAFALAQRGKPYQFGATGPDRYDCSGLVQRAYAVAGVSIPRTTYQQVLIGTAVSRDNLAPGDLWFPDPGHVGMYLGGGKVVSAPHTGDVVHVTTFGPLFAARRVVPTPGRAVNVPLGTTGAATPGQPTGPGVTTTPTDFPGTTLASDPTGVQTAVDKAVKAALAYAELLGGMLLMLAGAGIMIVYTELGRKARGAGGNVYNYSTRIYRGVGGRDAGRGDQDDDDEGGGA